MWRSRTNCRGSSMRSLVFFFFQAEDGIRVGRVTGVQTCALPICLDQGGNGGRGLGRRNPDRDRNGAHQRHPDRSEERRVGKESRSRWAGNYLKKKVRMVLGMAFSNMTPRGGCDSMCLTGRLTVSA